MAMNIESGIKSEYEVTQSKLKNPVSNQIITVDSANVDFFPSDIPRIISLMIGTRE
jgi:hypothetical protein